MSGDSKSAAFVASIVLAVMAPAIAQAQDQRLRMAFAPAAATVSGGAELALGGSFGYRFSERFWFEGDLTWIDAASGAFGDPLAQFNGRDRVVTQFTNPSGPVVVSPVPPGSIGVPTSPIGPGTFPSALPTVLTVTGPLDVSTGGSTTVGTIGIRYDLPVETARFRPYVAGGLGLNHTRQHLRFGGTLLPGPVDQSFSHTGYAFNAGAGAGVRVFRQLWVDVDAKYFRLTRDRDVMRLGGGVSVVF
jgi:opacity protein-like surface antigen